MKYNVFVGFAVFLLRPADSKIPNKMDFWRAYEDEATAKAQVTRINNTYAAWRRRYERAVEAGHEPKKQTYPKAVYSPIIATRVPEYEEVEW